MQTKTSTNDNSFLFPEQKKTGDIYLVQQAGRVWPDSILLQNQKNWKIFRENHSFSTTTTTAEYKS